MLLAGVFQHTNRRQGTAALSIQNTRRMPGRFGPVTPFSKTKLPPLSAVDTNLGTVIELGLEILTVGYF